MNTAALLAGLFSGILGSMGLGGGAVLVIYLSVFTETEQLVSQGINLLFFIPIAVIAVIVYSFKKQIKWSSIIKITVFGLIGTLIGIMLTDYLGGKITGKVFGGMLILIGIREIFSKNTKNVAKGGKS